MKEISHILTLYTLVALLLFGCNEESLDEKVANDSRVRIDSLPIESANLLSCIEEAGWLYVDQVVQLECLNLDSTNDIKYFTALNAAKLIGAFSELDVSHNLALESLEVSSDELISVDLSLNSELTTIYLSVKVLEFIKLPMVSSHLNELALSSSVLSSVDLTPAVNLSVLLIQAPLTTLNVADNSYLQTVRLDSPAIEYINFENNFELESIILKGGELTAFDFPVTESLKAISIHGTAVSTVNVSGLLGLEFLNLPTSVTTVDVSNTKVDSLGVESDELESFIATNSALISLWITAPQLEFFDISGSVNLSSLSIETNRLPVIDMSTHTALESFSFVGEGVAHLDLSSNSLLTGVHLSSPEEGIAYPETNLLETVSVIGCENGIPEDLQILPSLKYLTITDCRMDRFELEANESLVQVMFHNSFIKEVDLTKNLSLDGVILDWSVVESLILPDPVQIKWMTLLSSSKNCENFGAELAEMSVECRDDH